MILTIALPPVRLTNRSEDAFPHFIANASWLEQQFPYDFSYANLLDTCKYIAPCFCANLLPIQRRQDLEQTIFASHCIRTLINLIPNTRTRFIYIAIFRC